MAIDSINFNKHRSCVEGDVSLHEVEVRALNSVGGIGGQGSPVDTLLAQFTSITDNVPFGLVNMTAVDIAQYFVGAFPNDITIDITNLAEDVKVRYRVTDACGISNWAEKDFIKSPFDPFAFVSSGIGPTDSPSAPQTQLAFSGYKTDIDGKQVDLEAGDVFEIEVYSPRLAAVVASIQMYVGFDITVDNEGVTYVTGTNNNWFDSGDGFGEHLDSLVLDATLLRTGSITTNFAKRDWAEANNYIGTNLGDAYEIRVRTIDMVSGMASPQDTSTILKMYGITVFQIRMRSEIGEVAPYNTCLNARHWRIVVTDSFRGDLPPANARGFFDEATIETNQDGGAWSAGAFIVGADDGICCEQSGGGQIVTGVRFQLQTPPAYPWVEAPPATLFEQFGRCTANSAAGDEYCTLLLDSSPTTIQDNYNKIITIDAEIRSDMGTRQGDLLEFNNYMGPSAGDDPQLNNAFFAKYYNFLTGSFNERIAVSYELNAEGWYRGYSEIVGESGGTRFVNSIQRSLYYLYSF